MICPHSHDEGMVERLATPEEVAVGIGAEFGITFDRCPECPQPHVVHFEMELVDLDPELLDTLLGVPTDEDYDRQAEQGQGPPG